MRNHDLIRAASEELQTESAAKPFQPAARSSRRTRKYNSSTKMKITMKTTLFASTLAAGMFVTPMASFAQTISNLPHRYLTRAPDRFDQGQYPLQPDLRDRTAQPQCGFAATQDWGANGFQWCNSKNMYPQPRTYRSDAFGQSLAKRK